MRGNGGSFVKPGMCLGEKTEKSREKAEKRQKKDRENVGRSEIKWGRIQGFPAED